MEREEKSREGSCSEGVAPSQASEDRKSAPAVTLEKGQFFQRPRLRRDPHADSQTASPNFE